MAATLAAAAAPLASQPRVFGYCRARVVRPSWRIIARGALGIEVTGEDDGEDLSMEFANIHEGESRRRSCAADVVRVALHGQRTDGDDAIERCLKRLPLPDLQVPKSLLNLASPGSSSFARAAELAAPSEIESTRRRGRARVRMRAHPGPSQGRRETDAVQEGEREYLAELFLLAGLHLEGPTRPNPLSRFDLFHAHLWTGETSCEGRVVPVVGLLMHAMEYPRADPSAGFELDLGRCHFQSSCAYDPAANGVEEIFSGARPRMRDGPSSARSIPRRGGARRERGLCVVPELHTTFEGDFGEVAGDVLYLHAPLDRRAKEKVFAFPR